MHTTIRRFLTGLTAASVGLFGTASVAASADTPLAKATIVQADPERSCAGEPATVSWTAPEGVAGLTGYRIVQQRITPFPSHQVREVGPDQTNLDFIIPFGLTAFQI